VPYAAAPTRRSVERLVGASATPLWLDNPARPEAAPPMVGAEQGDLAVVGAGFTGLWTALLAKQGDPRRDVVLLEGGRVAQAATGRNGGFCSASLTHGLSNGHSRFAAELPQLLALGAANLTAIEQTTAEFGIDCDWRRAGDLLLATDPHHLADLAEAAELAGRYGEQAELLDADQVRERVVSPRYLGGLLSPDGLALLDPARLAWGLRRACLELGVRLYEGTPVTGLATDGPGMRLTTPADAVRERLGALIKEHKLAPRQTSGGTQQEIVPAVDRNHSGALAGAVAGARMSGGCPSWPEAAMPTINWPSGPITDAGIALASGPA